MPDPPFVRPLSYPEISNAKGLGKVQALQQIEGKPAVTSDLKSACQQFESLFLSFMLKEMRDTIPKSELLEAGQAEEIYTSLLDIQLSHELAQKGGIGLASILEKYLSNQPDEKTSQR
jgi:flagellar protein FlgJ